MRKWNVRSFRSRSDNFGCLMVFVSVLIVVFAIASVAMYLLGYFSHVELFLQEFGMTKFYTYLSIASVLVLAACFGLAYIGMSQMVMFCIFDILTSLLSGFLFYNAASASSVGDDILIYVPVAAWLAIVSALAVSFIPSVIASLAVYFVNIHKIKKSEVYKLFIDKFDELVQTRRLYKVLITSEKISVRSPSQDMWRVYFDELGYDDLFGRAYDAFVAAARSELGRQFSYKRVEDYCVSFTSRDMKKQIRSAIRQHAKNPNLFPDAPYIDDRSDSELARSSGGSARRDSGENHQRRTHDMDLSDEGDFLRKDPLSFGADFKGDSQRPAPANDNGSSSLHGSGQSGATHTQQSSHGSPSQPVSRTHTAYRTPEGKSSGPKPQAQDKPDPQKSQSAQRYVRPDSGKSTWGDREGH